MPPGSASEEVARDDRIEENEDLDEHDDKVGEVRRGEK